MDFKLSRLAAISFATSILNNSQFNEVVHNYREDESLMRYKSYIKLIQQTREKLEQFLPKTLLNEVLYVIESMTAKRWFVWHQHIQEKFGFRFIKPVKMHWTCYGTVDTAKIVSEEWSSLFDANGKLQSNHAVHFLGSPEEKSLAAEFVMHYMACSCILRSYIESNFLRMLQFCEGRIQDRSYKKSQIKFIICSVCFFIDSKKLRTYLSRPFCEDISETWEKKTISPAQMFSMSVEQGCGIAARYYWDLMIGEEKYNLLWHAALRCCGIYEGRVSPSYQLFIIQDVIVFLFMQMTEDQKHAFLLDRTTTSSFFRDNFFNIWPWEDLFFPGICYVEKLYSLNRNSDTLVEVAKNMKHISNVGYDYKPTIYYKICCKGLKEFPHYMFRYDHDIFLDLFDFQILKMIMNIESHIDLTHDKKRLITPTYDNVFGKLVRGDKFHVLEEFMEKVLNSQEEIQKWFKKYSDWHPEFVKHSDFETLDKLLAWQYETDEERKTYKRLAIEQNGLVLDQLCETRDIGWLTEIWISCLNSSENYELKIRKAKTKTSDFLKWLFEKDEDILQFKEEFMDERRVNDFMLELSSQDLKCASPLQVLIEWLTFFLSAKKLTHFKKKVAKEVDEWLCFLVVGERGVVLTINPAEFLDFIIPDDGLKRKVIRKVFLTKCPNYYSDEYFVYFLDVFESPAAQIHMQGLAELFRISFEAKELENYLKKVSLKLGPRLTQNGLSNLKTFVDLCELKDGRSVTVQDAEESIITKIKNLIFKNKSTK